MTKLPEDEHAELKRLRLAHAALDKRHSELRTNLGRAADQLRQHAARMKDPKSMRVYMREMAKALDRLLDE